MVWYMFVIPWYGIRLSYHGMVYVCHTMVWYCHTMVWYKFVIPWYVSPWYGMTMGWLYTLGKPLAWCVAYTILSVAVFLSSLFFVLLK